MIGALVVLAIWCGVSVPVGLIVGRLIRGRCHDPERCQWCRQMEDW